jgi:hypothetical protein
MSRPKGPDLSAKKAAAREFLAQEYPRKTEFLYTLNPTQMFDLLAKFAKSLLPANEAAETEPADGDK